MRIAPEATGTGDRSIVARNANVQNFFGAHENLIFRTVRHTGEAEVIGFLEIQGRARTRDAPPRVPESLDDTVEVFGQENGHPGEGLVDFYA